MKNYNLPKKIIIIRNYMIRYNLVLQNLKIFFIFQVLIQEFKLNFQKFNKTKYNDNYKWYFNYFYFF